MWMFCSRSIICYSVLTPFYDVLSTYLNPITKQVYVEEGFEHLAKKGFPRNSLSHSVGPSVRPSRQKPV